MQLSMILLYNIIYVLTWSLTCFSHQVDIIENYYYELSCTQFYCKHPQFPFQNIVQMSKLTKKVYSNYVFLMTPP